VLKEISFLTRSLNCFVKSTQSLTSYAKDTRDFVIFYCVILFCSLLQKGKQRYLQVLAQVLGVDRAQVLKAAQSLLESKVIVVATIAKV
jgi:hypothetical protein